VQPWQWNPLGFAIVHETSRGNLAIHHVSILEDGIFASGLWDLPAGTPKKEIQDRITHWIIVGTSDGIAATKKICGETLPSADLSGLVGACEAEEARLQAEWEKYRDLEPKKRSKLKPLAARNWPAVQADGDAAKLLKKVGRRPYVDQTPLDMRDIIAFSRLIIYIMETWYELESERLARHYLHSEQDQDRQLFPPDWLKRHSPYWPKVK